MSCLLAVDASRELQQYLGIGLLGLAAVAVIVHLVQKGRRFGNSSGNAASRFKRSPYHPFTVTVRPTYTAVAVAISVAAVFGSLTPYTPIELSLGAAWQQFRQIDIISWGYHGRVDWGSNFLLGLGLGLAWQAVTTPEGRHHPQWKGRAAVTTLSIMAVLALIEFLQLWLPSRVTSPHDLQAQLLGILCGVYTWRVGGLWVTRQLSAWLSKLRPAQPIDWFARSYLAVFLFYSLKPFDITIHPVELYRKFAAGRVILVPFSGSEYLFEEMFRHALSYLPVGVLAAIAFTPARRPLRRIEPAILISFAMACAIEPQSIEQAGDHVAVAATYPRHHDGSPHTPARSTPR
ncbi:MAG: hypothetical protein ACF8TS_19865, partial [Maioricimonas sp. JB049]